MYDYDRKIENSEYGFGKLDNKIKLKSDLEEYLNLNYMYVLNNFYIEKLNKEALNILDGNDGNLKRDLISKTYKTVILSNYHKGQYIDKKYKVNYTNSDNINKFSYNDELVLAIYYGKNTVEYGSKEKYLENFKNKKTFLQGISNELVKEFKDKLDLNLKVIFEKYFDDNE